MPDHATGGCLCGQIRFAAALPSLWCAHCHCTLCQRAHGAAFVTWVGFPADRVALDPAATLRWYPSTPSAERGFCGTCGTTLFFRSERWDGELHIARACVEGPLDRAPQAHVFYATHVHWLDVADDLPKKP